MIDFSSAIFMTDIRTKVEALLKRPEYYAWDDSPANDNGWYDKVEINLYLEKLEPLVRASVGLCEAVEYAHAALYGTQHTNLPIHVREQDGSISQVRERSMCGNAYDKLGVVLAAFTAEVERAGK